MFALRRLAAVVIALASLAAPALAASESGSHGWSTANLTLRDGPGPVYAITGEIPADTAIKILRCQRLWCVVDGPGGRGWASKDHVSFGKTSTPWPGGINPDYAYGEGGSVCFYTGTNYTGSRLCAGGGEVFPDLALRGLDNVFASVEVIGRASAAACRDRFFQSYCERIVSSQPVLDRYLVRNLSSIRVY